MGKALLPGTVSCLVASNLTIDAELCCIAPAQFAPLLTTFAMIVTGAPKADTFDGLY